MKILSFDISSSTIGYCYSENYEIRQYGFVDISRIESIYLLDKVRFFRDFFNFPESVDKIVIEEPLKLFRGGNSSIDTILLLSKINSLISFILYEKYNVYPEYINASTVRKNIGLKIDKTSLIEKKQQILNYIDSNKIKLFTLKTKSDKIDKRNWDVSDSIAVNLSSIYCQNK